MTDDRRRALLIGSRAVLLRWVVCVAAAAVLGLPLAVSWAVTHTVVQEKVGTSPTTFTLSTQGQSELRLGIAGTIYVPRAVGPLGVRATVDGPGDPGAGNGDLANYVRPEMLALYTGLFHDPGPAIDQYVGLVQDELRRQLVRSVVVTSLGGSDFRCDLAVRAPGADRWTLGVLVDHARRLRTGSTEQRRVVQPGVLRASGWRVEQVTAAEWLAGPDAVVERLAARVHVA